MKSPGTPIISDPVCVSPATVADRHVTMKEQTYGWYPSAKDVYKDRRLGAPTAYHIEAMYKFNNSTYYLEPQTPPPPSLQVAPPPRKTPTPSPSRPKSVVSTRQGSAGSLQVRAMSAPIYDFKPAPRLQIPTPHQCWVTKVDQTPYDTFPTTPTPIPTPTTPNKPPTAPTSALGRMSSRERVKSAMIRRERPPLPTRPVKSAGPTRPQVPTTTTPVPRSDTDVPCRTPSVRPASSPAALSRKQETRQSVSADVITYDDIPEDQSPIPDEDEAYDKLVEKYGWRAQLHGDPLKLKRQVIQHRYPYTVKVAEPVLPPDPPTVHMESKDTFFLNTIPRRPLAFTIHRDWMSEAIHAKRMELQKRQGIKYRYKNFSFVY
ncbi:hypothetical protein ScPMuIL_006953 [Solemya velum]